MVYPKYCKDCILDSYSLNGTSVYNYADGYYWSTATNGVVFLTGICYKCYKFIEIIKEKVILVIWYDSKEHAENIKNGVS